MTRTLAHANPSLGTPLLSTRREITSNIHIEKERKCVPEVESATQISWSMSASLPKTGDVVTAKNSTIKKAIQEISPILIY